MSTMTKRMFLGLDLGTTNVKAVVCAADGSVVARGSAPCEVRYVGENGVEQDIEDIWSAALTAIREAGETCDLPGVRAVGVSSQGGALQMLDGEEKPVGPVIGWMDGRAGPYVRELNEELGREWFVRHIGHGGFRIGAAHLLRFREESPELAEPPHRMGFVGDVIVGRLCGRRAHDPTSLSLAMLLNPRERRADPELLDKIGLTEDRLPELLPATEAAGVLTPEAAELTGLPAGIPVSPAVHDQYAAALGCGAVHAGDVMFGAGTAWVLLAVAGDEPGREGAVLSAGFTCPHPVDGLYGRILSMANGGSSFRWAVQTLGLDELSGAELDALIEEAPAGCEGLRFRPLLAPGGGMGLPRGTAGRLDGIRLAHTRAHVLRAVVEGLAMELTRYVRLLEEQGTTAERLIMCGGAADSAVTPRIVADAVGLPVACIAEGEVSALGGAVLARALVDDSRELAALSETMRPEERLLNPGPPRGLYGELFREYRASLSKST
ncbi:MAG: FGGY-family carbohydrate kinase [Candidatus Brocadiia bacterium]